MTDRTKAPEVRDFDNVTLDIPQCETLPNGVELTVINYGEVEVCQVDVYIKGGFLHESQPGLVTFVAKMLNKGTTDYSVDQIAEKFDYYGTELALADSGVAISASLKTTNRNLPQVLPLMYDCITKSTFPQDMLEKAKEKAIADLAVMRERVSYLARRKLVQLLVGESHPMAKSADDERVKDITRDNLLDYHRRYFVPGNCIVVVSGKISSAELDLVRNIFGSWESRTVERRDEIPECPQPSMFEVVQKDDAVQSSVLISIDAVPRIHPDFIKLRILTTAFGGYYGSRLMRNIREEKGYTYGIQSYILGRPNQGRIEISTQCGTQYTAAVIEEIKHEMRMLREQPIGDDELNQVRQYMMSDLVKTLDNAFSRASFIGLIRTGNIYPEYFDLHFEQIKTVTAPELQHLAQKYLTDDRMRIVVAGDKAEMGFD